MHYPRVDWKGYKVTPNEKILLGHIVGGQMTGGIEVDDVRHLLNGDSILTRNTLIRLAEKKLLKKRLVKRSGLWGDMRSTRKVRVYYPVETFE